MGGEFAKSWDVSRQLQVVGTVLRSVVVLPGYAPPSSWCKVHISGCDEGGA